MADLDPLGLFPNSKMGQAAKLGQSRFYSREKAVVSVAPIVWSTTDLSNTTLSNGNLTAKTASPNGGVRGAASLSSGKYYWEMTYTTINTNGISVGVALASATVTGTSGTGIANILRTTGGISVNSVGSGSSLGIINQGAVICIAIDLTAKLIWFRNGAAGQWNGSGTANPATGTGGVNITTISTGPLFPIMYGQLNDVVTANFGSSTFTGTVPSGFTAGWLA